MAKEAFEGAAYIIAGKGKVINKSDRMIYAIISETENVAPIAPRNTHSALIDGVVDVVGKQVYKMNENTYLEFTGNYEFVINEREKLNSLAGEFSNEPYGLYRIIGDSAIHSITGYKSNALKRWYDKSKGA